jgi:hypothetical protein
LRADAGGLTVETDALPPRVLAFLFLCLQIVCWLIGMGAWFGVMYLIFTRYAGA